jgi:hypothetical protein
MQGSDSLELCVCHKQLQIPFLPIMKNEVRAPEELIFNSINALAVEEVNPHPSSFLNPPACARNYTKHKPTN